MNYIDISRALRSTETMERLLMLYGRHEGVLVGQVGRYGRLLKVHEDLFRAEDVAVISAPGRSEIIGNHTDHNNGLVLAAAVNLDTLAVVSVEENNQVTVVSEGYEPIRLDLSSLQPLSSEEGTPAALIRGVAERMAQLGYAIGGFNAAITSDVLSGSGLSSSAAFETLVCCILDTLYNNGDMDPVERAQISQYAENVHFGKPSGLMDQMASSVGGLIGIDFKKEEPEIAPVRFSFQEHGYAMVVVNTGGSHDDLTQDYADIRVEMVKVAEALGQPVLRQVRPEQLLQNIRSLRQEVGDRAILRALHYFDENERVAAAIDALKHEDMPRFLKQIRGSGRSSWQLLQNMYAHPEEQPMSISAAVAEQALRGRGATRIHGGGFAGTTLHFVPLDLVDEFVKVMDGVFGEHASHVLDVRPIGACRVF